MKLIKHFMSVVITAVFLIYPSNIALANIGKVIKGVSKNVAKQAPKKSGSAALKAAGAIGGAAAIRGAAAMGKNNDNYFVHLLTKSLKLNVGECYYVAVNKSVGNITVSSDNPSVASASWDAQNNAVYVIAKSSGNTNVRIKVGDASDFCSICVPSTSSSVSSTSSQGYYQNSTYTSMSLSNHDISLYEGQTYYISAQLSNPNSLSWTVSSNNPSVADWTWDNNKQLIAIRAHSPGSAVITSSLGDVSDCCTVSVFSSKQSVSWENDKVTLCVGEIKYVSVSIIDSRQDNWYYGNDNPEAAFVTYDSDKKAYRIEGKAPGDSWLSVYTNTSNNFPVCHIIVKKKTATINSISPNYVKLSIGETVSPIVNSYPSLSKEELTYYSENKQVATIDAKGNITAVGPGETNIWFMVGSSHISCLVTVETKSVTLSDSEEDVDFSSPVRTVYSKKASAYVGETIRFVLDGETVTRWEMISSNYSSFVSISGDKLTMRKSGKISLWGYIGDSPRFIEIRIK